MNIETISRAELEKIQLEKLKTQVKWTYDNVQWFKDKMNKAGVQPKDIRCLDDISKLPTTDKSDFRETYPYGLFAVSLDDVLELHSSSGTTGKPVVVGYNQHDMDVWADCTSRVAKMAGVTSKDIGQMAFGYGMFTGGFGIHYGLQSIGCMVIPAGSGNTERHIEMIEDYKTTVLISTPSYALYMCEVGEKLGYDWSKSTLKIGLFGGEPCSEHLRKEIESRMHIVCTDNYGLTEAMGPGVGGQCLCDANSWHIMEDHFLIEIVDPKTLKPVKDGEMGELLITPLDKQTVPVLRYRTHDLCRADYSECGCGRTHVRISKIRNRSDDMLIVRGTNVFPSQIADALSTINGLSPHFRIELVSENGLDVMIITVEMSEEAFSDSFSKLNSFANNIAARIKDKILVKPRVRLVGPTTIERSMGKTKFVSDNRQK